MVKIKRKLKLSPKKFAKPGRPSAAREIKGKKPKANDVYSKMSIDEFMNKDFEESDSGNEQAATNEGSNSEDENMSDSENSPEAEHEENENVPEKESDDELQSEEDKEPSNEDEFTSHKESLAKLKETDPEFFKFLRENDKKLLDFDLSDSDDDNAKARGVAEGEDKLHKPTGDLEVASDESDFEDDEETRTDSRVITLKMLKTWQKEVQVDKSNKTIGCLVKAFHAAVIRISNEEQEVSEYKVDGSSIFNGVIQLCVLELGPAIRKYLRLTSGSKQAPHKSKKFVKVRGLLRGYFTDLLKILSGVTSTNILNVLLKHLHYMSPMIVSFSSVTKPFLKKLIELWGTSDESVRVVAFLCILRITTNQQQNLLDAVLKMMYMTYVKNSKFVSTNALPGINFMRRSLVEMFALDVGVSYQHIFLYIRQLAIHLRNAITVNKKENVQAVYNWQFVNSLRLWGSLLSVTCNKPQLQPLVYPFVQVCLGTIKLVPTAQYYPLRFHVVQVLMDLSRETSVFIPILPFLLEVLTSYDFNKKHQKVSMKPLHFTCLLRLSKSQLSENGFKDTVIDTIYGQLLEYLASKSHSVAFPDLSLFCVIQIKQFTKKCTASNYCRKMRQILEKIEQNNKFILKERKNVTFNLKDFKQIEAWETTVRNKGTPLSTYYESWNKLRTIKKSKQATDNEAIGDYNLPMLKKVKRKENRSGGNDDVVLFPSDSESDVDGFGEKEESRPRRGKRGGRGAGKKNAVAVGVADDDDVGAEDIVEDLKLSDW